MTQMGSLMLGLNIEFELNLLKYMECIYINVGDNVHLLVVWYINLPNTCFITKAHIIVFGTTPE